MSAPDSGFSCIAVDMGAGSVRIMLGGLGADSVSYREVHRIENEAIRIDGHERWDMEKLVGEIRAGIAKTVEVAETPPVSIGVDSWGVDFVLLDDTGDLLELPVSYRDSRTEGMHEKWKEMMTDEETFRRTGINFYIFNTLFQLLSIRDSWRLQKASRILFLPCYVNYLLSGKARNELTIASTSQMLGIGGSEWDGDILEKLNLDPGKLVRVIPPGTVLGSVVLPEAARTGMKSVAVCGHDTACVVAAIPAKAPDFAFISAGTWCIVGTESDTPLTGEKALRLGLTNERGYGNSYRTLKNIVGLWLLQGLKKQLPGETDYSGMEEMTGDGGETMQVIDPDDPLFYNPENMKDAFDAFFDRTGQEIPGRFSDYLRCAYDSLCFSIRYHIEQLEQISGRRYRVLHLVGGGSRSDYLNQRIATICSRRVIAGPVEGAALGNILVQAIALGKIGSLKEGRALVRRSYAGRGYDPEALIETDEQRYEKYLKYKLNRQP